MKLISAAVAMFDKRQIQTVVPNRYLRTGVPSKNTHRQTLAFPGTVEVLLATPMTAVENAYKEHTADKLDTSRLVLWTDGSAAGSHYSERTRGFAVTWRRSTATGWGRWEAIGFQAQGELPDSSSMETLATVAIYTDSTSAIHIAQNPNHPLGLHIIRKARILTNFGPTLSLHWCPAHSDVPGNELADKIAGMARSHVYGGNAEFVDLSDDDDDGWEDG
ncbi:hypothetical protein P171DRAFT_227832 [Karstenula rhodostoma CBS 690.94]|uniref:RNase H type-1 domain-containing protein n=1 Tax=Karstenula rhodostoma CBS 690.94 TaxID=1392251 RepID=A0A9P4PQM3_9PLEO|nr:hypothetical protein P171DRAFT_227832 [Karstenula rhodostoma CBS 690.94]